MNLREFCQLRGYSDTLLTTFNFDPLFFERVVLSDLRYGGATRITVLVDAAQSLPAIETVQKQIFSMGRLYRVIPISSGGAFHPKVCIRMSKDRALVACGSGNLTRSGWLGRRSEEAHTGNREIVSAFQIEPNSSGTGELLAVRDQLMRVTELSSQQNAVLETLSQTWLDDAEATDPKEASWLLTGIDQPLAPILESRWRGRRFNRLHVVTGSTDAGGQMIRWAQQAFGIEQAIVHTDLSTCGFIPSQLEDLGLDLQIVGYDGSPRTHLKLAVFESFDGPSAAVAGSANCSGAAWLRSINENGNVESVLVYDTCDPSAFHGLYRESRSPKPWISVTLQEHTKNIEARAPEAPRILKKMELDSQTGQLRVSMDCDATHDEQVWAVVDSSRVPLSPSQNSKLWLGPQPDLKPGLLRSLFGHVEFEGPHGTQPTNSIWVDELDALAHAAEHHASSGSLYRLSRHGTSEEYRELIKNIHLLTTTLLDRPGEVADGVRAQAQAKPDDEAVEGPRIDPDSLLRSLSVQPVEVHTAHAGGVALGTNPLTGILRMIFAESQSEPSHPHADVTTAESQKSAEEEEASVTEEKRAEEPADGSETPSEIPTELQAKKLLDQLNLFVDKLADPPFGEVCTAQALKQAVAFPLGTAQFIRKGPWETALGNGAIDGVIERLCEVLLLRRVKFTDKKKGDSKTLDSLITRVRERYISEGRVDAFDQIVGDGTLWLVLSAAITGRQANDSCNLRRNLILRDIVRSPALLGSAVPDYLRPLAKRLAQNAQQPNLIDRLTVLNRTFTELESYLSNRFEELKSNRSTRPQVGDWLWNTYVGFAVIEKVQNSDWAWLHFREKENINKRVQLGCYINLMWMVEQDPVVARLMLELSK